MSSQQTAMSSITVVIGAGIIGLTTAIRVLESGRKAVILAKDLPGDPLTPTYASPCAGAHHLSFADDDDHRQRRLDKRTFDVMWKQLHTPNAGEEDEGAALLKITQIEYYDAPEQTPIKFYEEMPDFQAVVELGVTSSGSSVQPTHAVQFTTFTMDTGPYLAALVRRFNRLGGELVRAELPSLAAALSHPALQGKTVEAIVNCTGLGALRLADVADGNVHPVRGHVVVLKAPWIKQGSTLPGHSSGLHPVVGERTYIIPRKSGEVIIGGTRQANDW
jgi:D-amino-acid oxidase